MAVQVGGIGIRTVPALLIGVGGSGDWVLREVKSSFKRVHRDIPPNIKFVGIDTAAPGGGAAGKGLGGDQAEAKGPPRLDPVETVRATADLFELSTAISQAQHRTRRAWFDDSGDSMPHLRHWFSADDYIGKLPQTKYSLADGAGQLRQFGRMGVFLLESQGKDIRVAIRRGFQGILPFLGANQTVQVLIVSSVAGGTGAGMVIDVANIVRQEATQAGLEKLIALRAFLFLPQTFQHIKAINTSTMNARAYAAIREINRFNTDFDSDFGYPIPYSAAQLHDPASKLKVKLFENVYYIDGMSPVNPFVGTLPENAHYPMVAEAIRSLIDGPSGDAYQKWVINDWPGRDAVGSVGAYAIVLPVQMWRRGFELSLIKEILDVVVPATAIGGRLNPNARGKDGALGQAGRTGVSEFLTRGAVPDPSPESDGSIFATGFAREVHQAHQIYRRDNSQTIVEIANRGATTFRLNFGRLGVEDKSEGAPRALTEISASALVSVSDSWWPENQAVRSRAIHKTVSDAITKAFGKPGGDDGSSGEYRATAQAWHRLHRRRFRQVLAGHIDGLLNPPGDAIESRQARLGYVQDFLDGLIDQLSTYQQVMLQVQSRRSNDHLTSNATARYIDAESTMSNSAGFARKHTWTVIVLVAVAVGVAVGLAAWAGDVASSLWAAVIGAVLAIAVGFTLSLRKGPAYDAQHEYIDAADALLNEIETDELVSALILTADVVRRDVESLQSSVDNWAAAFVTGVGATSVAAKVKQQNSALETERATADTSLVRHYLWGDDYCKKLYERLVGRSDGESRKVAEFVKTLRWDYVEWSADEGSLPALRFGDGRDQKVDTGSPNLVASKLLAALHQGVQGVFARFEENVDIVTFMQADPVLGDPNAVARLLYQGVNEVKLAMKDAEWKRNRLQYNFLRIPDGKFSDSASGDISAAWVNNLLEQVIEITGKDSGTIIRGESSDPHSLALVYMVENIELKTVSGYVNAQDNYKNFMDNTDFNLGQAPDTLHCFAAEINAAKYERKMSGPPFKMVSRPFHGRIVRLLEHPDRVKQFLRALVLGVIGTNRGGEGALRQCVLFKRSGQGFSALTPIGETRPDIYAALCQFACGGESYASAQGLVVDRIDYAEVERLIEANLRERVPGNGPQEVVARLRIQLEALESYWPDDDENFEESEFDKDMKAPRLNRKLQDISSEIADDFTIILKLMMYEMKVSLLAQLEGLES